MILVKGSSTSLTGTSVLSIGLNQGNIPQELELGAKFKYLVAIGS